ncbi:imm11 family protein [Paenibacillus gansuensis]|uniref:Imm11 family protein n=1 Tax=Paenibacillus gansuensis TaxID=306542 RepID=A0ABW5P8I6_9BACL
MKIWRLEYDLDIVQGFVLKDQGLRETIMARNNFRGHSIQNWEYVEVKRSGRKAICDIYAFSVQHPIVSVKSSEFFKLYFPEEIQLLDVFNGKEKFYILNVINLIDCLDMDKSKIEYFSSGRIMEVVSYSFKPDLIKESYLFKVPQYPSKIFATDRMKKLVESTDLIGYKFVEVWNSERDTNRVDML